MTKYELTEGEARLLVAVFDHLKPYYEQAKAKHTSVADEMKNDVCNSLEHTLNNLRKYLQAALTSASTKSLRSVLGFFRTQGAARLKKLDESLV